MCPDDNVVGLPSSLLTREELAREMRISVKTLQRMRAEGRAVGLPCPEVTWGRRLVLFRLAPVLKWADQLEQHKRAA